MVRKRFFSRILVVCLLLTSFGILDELVGRNLALALLNHSPSSNSYVTLPGHSYAHPTPKASPPSIGSVSTSYTVQGKIIVDNNGKRYIPYGVHIPALFEPNWKNSVEYKHFTFQEMQAAKRAWHSNVVDFQVVETNLFADSNNPNTIDQDYLKAMDTAVKWANQENMNIILNLQTETTTGEIMATQDSIKFWQFVAQHYKGNQRVFFDLFNEPRIPSDWTMDLWKSGGVYNGVQYVGMQQLVDTVRTTGATNLIFVQGEGGGESLSQLASHLLTGANIVYAVHPYFSETQHLTQQQWDAWWGDSVNTVNVPISVNEWNQDQDSASGCIASAPSTVPTFLSYIKKLNVGLIAWALTPGTLIRGDGNPNDPWNWSNPTAFDQSVYTCIGNDQTLLSGSGAQGSGKLIMDFLAKT